VSKPATFGIGLPWEQGRAVYRGSYTYGSNDHRGSDSFALDFAIGPDGFAGVPSGGQGGRPGHERDIRAIAAGKVVWAGLWDNGTTLHCYGNTVAILHDYAGDSPNTYTSFYTHLASFVLNGVSVPPNSLKGVHVNQGDVIGIEGDSGKNLSGCDPSMPEHLHFVLYRNASTGAPEGSTIPLGGDPVVPEPFMGQDSQGYAMSYENFEWYGNGNHSPLIAGGVLATGAANPGGVWNSGVPADQSTISYNQPVYLSVHATDSVDISEVHLTASYTYTKPDNSVAPWNACDATNANTCPVSGPISFPSTRIWRILVACRLNHTTSNSSVSCLGGRGSWAGTPQSVDVSFSWTPEGEGLGPIGSVVPYLPSANPARTNASTTPTSVCISFDVIDSAGAANYAPNGVNCFSGNSASKSATLASRSGLGSLLHLGPTVSDSNRQITLAPPATPTPCPPANTWVGLPYLNRYYTGATDGGGNCTYTVTATTLETLTLSSGTNYAEANVDVDKTATVTLPDGATILTSGSASLTARGVLNIGAGTTIKLGGPLATLGEAIGTLNLNGTAAQPITLTSAAASPAPGDWAGVVFSGGSGVVSYVHQSYGGSPSGYYNVGLYVADSAVTIANSSFDHNLGDGVEVNRGVNSNLAPTLTNVSITNNANNGIEIHSGAPALSNVTVANNGGIALQYDTLPPSGDLSMLSNLSVSGNGQNIISIVNQGSDNTGVGTWPNLGLPIVQSGSYISISTGGNFTIAAGVQAQLTGLYAVSGGSVTIQAGVTLKFSVIPNGIGEGAGTLNLNGTAAQPITLTSAAASPAPGDWAGVVFNSGSGVVSYVHESYGGSVSGYYNAGLYTADSNPTVTSSSFDHNLGDGVQVNKGVNSSVAPSLTNVAITNNQGNGIEIHQGAPTLSNITLTNNGGNAIQYDALPPAADLSMLSNLSVSGNGQNSINIYNQGANNIGVGSWPNLGLPIIQTGNYISISAGGVFTIASGVQAQMVGLYATSGGSVTIQPGVTLQFNTPADGLGEGAGTLNLNGTAAQPITLTSAAASPAAGDWAGLVFNSGSGVVSYVHESYGGSPSGYYNAGLYTSGSNPTITNSSFDHNLGNGIEIPAASAPTMANVSITNNAGVAIQYDAMPPSGDLSMLSNLSVSGNGQNIVFINNSQGGNLTGVGAWPNLGLPIVQAGPYINISTGGNFTIAAGAQAQIDGLYAVSGGSVTIQAGVTLKFDAAGAGLGTGAGTLNLNGTAAQPITLTSAAASPAPGDWPGLQYSSGSGVVSYVHESYAGANNAGHNTGLLIDSSSPTIAHSTIDHSAGNNVEVANGGLPVLRYNSFGAVPAGKYGVVNDGWTSGQPLVDATFSWWGQPTGPTAADNPSGTGTPVSSGVAYSPWVGKIPGPVLSLSSSSGGSGSSVTLKGSGFGTREKVDIYVGTQLVGTTQVEFDITIVNVPLGQISTSITIPSLPSGIYTVQVIGRDSGRMALASFIIT
jgi:hypothetical protein